MEVSGQFHTPTTLPPRKEPPNIHLILGWVDMDMVAKKKIPALAEN
jgi:hypothetical protein